MRVRFAFLAAVLAAAAMAGCGPASDLAEGCNPPANEAALLEAYAKEPALGVQPGGSTQRVEPTLQPACHQVADTVSRTSVFVEWDVKRNVNEAEIQSLYERVTTGAGWTPMPDRSSTQYATFCKDILGERSIMDLSWQDSFVRDNGQVIPGVVAVGVRIANENERSCP